MPTPIQIKRMTVAGRVANTAALTNFGELARNGYGYGYNSDKISASLRCRFAAWYKIA